MRWKTIRLVLEILQGLQEIFRYVCQLLALVRQFGEFAITLAQRNLEKFLQFGDLSAYLVRQGGVSTRRPGNVFMLTNFNEPSQALEGETVANLAETLLKDYHGVSIGSNDCLVNSQLTWQVVPIIDSLCNLKEHGSMNENTLDEIPREKLDEQPVWNKRE